MYESRSQKPIARHHFVEKIAWILESTVFGDVIDPITERE